MLKKRNKAMISLLLSFTIFLSYMLPLLNGLPDLLPSVTIHAADDTSGITQYGNVKRYDSIDLFEKDYPDDAEQFRKDFNTIDGEKKTAYKGFSYDNFKVVVSLFESGENFAMLYDANRYPDVEGEFDLSDFSAFATHYCKYLNTLKELTGVSHGVLNVFLHTESGLSPGWWSSTLNVNTNRDYTDGVLTGIKNCTKSDFYSNWCLLHETSHSYSESYFNIHSETSVNLRSFAALHAMDYLNYDGFHLMVDKLGGFDNESEPLKTSKIFTDAEIGDTPKDYTTERYMDTFHDTIVSGLKTTYFYYDSLDDVNAKVIYGNCSTLDAAILSACTQTNLLQYFDADDPDYMVETEEYEKIFKNALNGSDSKIDWDQFYAQFIVNADNINENSFMKGALEVYHNYVDDAKNQINVESGNVMYVTDTVKNFLDSNYKSNNGIYPVSHLFVRFYENLELISGDITFPSGSEVKLMSSSRAWTKQMRVLLQAVRKQ